MKSVFDFTDEFQKEWKNLTDKQFLRLLDKFQPLAEEDDPAWEDEEYWINGLYQFWAFSVEATKRGLTEAIPLLLDRATEFDQDNLLEGLRHNFEEIMKPDWAGLADICIEKSKSKRTGTRKWSLYQLIFLDDPRAKTIFKKALKEKNQDIQGIARLGLERLAKK
jgi:hypothetical protein